MYTLGKVLVNPASLVRGLAAALPESITLFEASPVLAREYGSVHTLKLDRAPLARVSSVGS